MTTSVDTMNSGRVIHFSYSAEDERVIYYLELWPGPSPALITLGTTPLPPGIELALSEMGEGESRTVTLGPMEAFGKFSEELLQQVHIKDVPVHARKSGALFTIASPQGIPVPVTVEYCDQTSATLNFNHPLAGETVTLTLTVLSVASAFV